MSAIVFDFDGTLTIKRAKDNYNLIELFGGYERILNIVSFIHRLHLKNINLYICSGNTEELIRKIIQDLTDTGFYIELDWFKKINGENAEKAEFVNGLTEDRIVFIDDNRVEDLNPNVTFIFLDKKPLTPSDHELRILALLNVQSEAGMETPGKRPKTVFETPKSTTNLGCSYCSKKPIIGFCICKKRVYCGIICQEKDFKIGKHYNHCL